MIFVGARNFNYRVCTYSSPMSKKMTTPENDALFGYRTVSYTHLTLPTSDLV